MCKHEQAVHETGKFSKAWWVRLIETVIRQTVRFDSKHKMTYRPFKRQGNWNHTGIFTFAVSTGRLGEIISVDK